MKISVVIPAYNEEEYLPLCLESLKKQDFTGKDFEIIIVDNNSTDKTSKIAKKFGAKVVFEKRQGITYARDKGGRMAKGKIIVSSDADCTFSSDYLKTIYEKFKKDKKLNILCTSVRMPDAPIAGRMLLHILHLAGIFYSKLYKGSTPVLFGGANFAYRRDVFLNVGGYRFDSPLLKKGINTGGTDDFDIVSRIKNAGGKSLFVPELTVNTSGRRFKGRFLYWFFVEYLFGFIINSYLSKVGLVIPVPSYFIRRKPSFIENFTLNTSFAFVVLLLITSFIMPFFANRDLREQVKERSVSSYQKYEKVLVSNFIDPLKDSKTFKELIDPYRKELEKAF